MRFIHAADIHLDSPLTGLAAYPDAPAELLRTATRDAFANLVTVAIEEKIDFLIIAGDLYDGNWKDFNTGIFFSSQMGRLKVAAIPVYLLYGNHDADSEMTRTLSLPDNVHRFPSNKAATFRLPGLKVALHGRSFKDAATTDNLAVNYPDPVAGWLNIGVLHTALEGNSAHAHYAPCSIAELEARGYQYWALGHVHEYKLWRGDCVIAFPGNLQGRHIREAGPRGALLVSFENAEIGTVDRLLVDVLRWHALEVDVAPADSLAEAVRLAGRALEQLVEKSGVLPLVVRVTLTGASKAHGELFGLETQLRAEVLAHAASIGSERLWIEKLRLDTSPHALAGDVTARLDAVADLQALLSAAEFDPVFMKSLEEDLMQLIGKLPLEVIDALASVRSVRAGETRALVRAIGPALLDYVAKAG
ncbi:metallophosphoesterase family protein [Massilia psychrophila]|uniref:DNA repair exonuclease n=1 Tax=Massilia psychrophila TaxID=1603353 RepID=A0A2G8SX19_9BURK|nr:DNA repair exonuclease [Massilia psychrophila]PIL38028.1 DNA repair exonuclease [Massilia psychrophila]GGE91579.1 metallophosphoesterase [Massilia psychrophila]